MSTLQSIVEKSIDRVEYLLEIASSGQEIEECLSALERLEEFSMRRGLDLDLGSDSKKTSADTGSTTEELMRFCPETIQALMKGDIVVVWTGAGSGKVE